jgi:hypothetical protein
MDQTKPGYKTTEFWLSLLAVLISAFIASGVLPEGHTVIKIAAMAASILSALGYSVSRASVKKASLTIPEITPPK